MLKSVFRTNLLVLCAVACQTATAGGSLQSKSDLSGYTFTIVLKHDTYMARQGDPFVPLPPSMRTDAAMALPESLPDHGEQLTDIMHVFENGYEQEKSRSIRAAAVSHCATKKKPSLIAITFDDALQVYIRHFPIEAKKYYEEVEFTYWPEKWNRSKHFPGITIDPARISLRDTLIAGQVMAAAFRSPCMTNRALKTLFPEHVRNIEVKIPR